MVDSTQRKPATEAKQQQDSLRWLFVIGIAICNIFYTLNNATIYSGRPSMLNNAND